MSKSAIRPRSGKLSARTLVFLKACFSSPLNAALSIAILLALGWAVGPFLHWAVIDAVWHGSTSADCKGADGACWIFITNRLGQILYGPYPPELRWRIDLAGVAGLAGLLTVIFYPNRRKRLQAAGVFFIGYTILSGILLRGGLFGLADVPTRQWGGLMLTIIIAGWTIATSVPLGLFLALSRRSRLPVIAKLSAVLIDTIRALPLVGLLFLAIVMFPFFVPEGMETDRLIRALIAFTVFNAANLAEVFRGGLQTVPPGQAEAGAALGLSRRHVSWLVVVPQATYLSLPAIVNVCIAIIKETTIVLIVGLFDFLGVLQAGLSDPVWLEAQQARATAYVFAAAIFWVLCFGLSRYSVHLEQQLAGYRKAK